METQKKASSSTTDQLLSPTASQQLSSVAPADKPLAPAEQLSPKPVFAREGVEKKRKFEICVQKKQPVAKKDSESQPTVYQARAAASNRPRKVGLSAMGDGDRY